MSHPIAQAAAALGATLTNFAGQTVEYCRGDASAVLAAVHSRKSYEQSVGYGMTQTFDSDDFLIAAADLHLSGQPALPRAGDQIRAGGGTYEVMPLSDSQPPYQWSDPHRQRLRVHTRQIEDAR